MCKRLEKEIEFYKELFNKAVSISILVAAGTITLWHKNGFSLWVGIGIVALYFSLIITGITLKKWRDKINVLED
ncbi:hypothetical protein [Desulfurobacterium crinifex]|jgi:hypothetical protein